MPFELRLALKYFRARRKSLARFTSMVAVVGIAAGVASLIIAQALARGFADEMRDKILSNTAHVSIFSASGVEISNWREVKETLEKVENVREVSATVYESAIIAAPQATSYAVLRVVGSPQTEEQIAENRAAESANQTIEISIGKELAEKTNLKAGERAEIITLENESAPRTSEVFIRDVFQTGLYEYDATWIIVSPENFVRLKHEITHQKDFTPAVLSVSALDIYKTNETAREIRSFLGEDFRVIDWQEANQPLFAALSLERKVALAIISLIIFIAALNITTTLALLVNERRLDIAVLRTCGAKARNLIFIFLLEGLFLGFLGIFIGTALGLLGCFLGNYFQVISLSAEVYSLSYIPFRPVLPNILLVIFVAFALCLAATFYPAWRASRIKPLENLRTQ